MATSSAAMKRVDVAAIADALSIPTELRRKEKTVANEMAAKERYPYEPTVQQVHLQLIDRMKRERAIVDMEASELTAEVTNLRRGLAEANGDLSTAKGEIEAYQALVRRARATIRNMHLQLHPKHRAKLDKGDPGLKVGDKNRLRDNWCPTCAVLVEMDEERSAS